MAEVGAARRARDAPRTGQPGVCVIDGVSCVVRGFAVVVQGAGPTRERGGGGGGFVHNSRRRRWRHAHARLHLPYLSALHNHNC